LGKRASKYRELYGKSSEKVKPIPRKRRRLEATGRAHRQKLVHDSGKKEKTNLRGIRGKRKEAMSSQKF